MKMIYQKPETEIIRLECEDKMMVMSLTKDDTPGHFPGTSNSSFFKDSNGILGGDE